MGFLKGKSSLMILIDRLRLSIGMESENFGTEDTIYKQKCFLHLIQQPKYEMVMPCKADYSPAKSFYDVKNLSGLI